MSQFGFVDGSDTQRVHFFEPTPAPSAGSAWFFNQSSVLLGAVYNSTLAGCNASGASVVFTFNGSNIFVFGSVVDPGSSSPPVSVYTVDGGSPTTFTAPQTTGRQDVVQFFGSSNMPLTIHTLTINITNASPGAPYYLDYLQYNVDVLPPLSSSVAPTSTSASAISSSSSTADSTVTSATPSATASAVAETKQTAPMGAIVGGVIGGLALLFVLIGALYWRRNRRPSGEFRYGTKAHQDTAPPVVPYMTASSLSLHGHASNPSPALYMPRAGGSASSPSREVAISQVNSSGGATPSHSEGNATAPSQPQDPPVTSTRRQRLTLSYMRPPSTEGGGFPYPDMEAFSDPGGGEVLPAYSPGPP
ncbi:hypothetical protein TRAPUB_2934 [Trametes pubescens]|uniref:Mid2 domain-containing protein n=1 Tax=Trametes pubescens TaxID=154538 RepID=A0A1M2VF21_TRAPU|nr:hypothetical protein TRAPUB_2934 [Trametes pubescens]